MPKNAENPEVDDTQDDVINPMEGYPEHEEEDQEALEAEARRMGWQPEDKFRGKKGQWVDAQTFVERGRSVMPILAQNNKALRKQVLNSETRIDTLSQQLDAANQAIEKLVKQNAVAARQTALAMKKQLAAQLKDARQENDVEAELEIQGQLQEVNRVISEADKAKDEPTPKNETASNKQSDLSPEITAWMGDNTWYQSDKKRTRAFNRFCEDLRDEDSEFADEVSGKIGREFLDLALELFEEHEEEKPKNKQKTSKVEEGNNRGHTHSTNSSSKGKGWASLPAEAKKSALEFQDDLVGQNKKYKTLKEWQDAYAADYWGG